MRLRPLPPSENDDYPLARQPEMDAYQQSHKNGRKSDSQASDVAALLSDLNVLTKV